MAKGNVEIKVSGTTVTITIDTTGNLGPSATGKTIIVGSTGGFVQVPGTDVSVNVTATKRP